MGLQGDSITPKRLKVTYSTTKKSKNYSSSLNGQYRDSYLAFLGVVKQIAAVKSPPATLIAMASTVGFWVKVECSPRVTYVPKTETCRNDWANVPVPYVGRSVLEDEALKTVSGPENVVIATAIGGGTPNMLAMPMAILCGLGV